MIKYIKRNTLPTIIALAALSVSASAAFYSISGLSKLFAGASFEVSIMATSLEVAKLVIASLLYQYWDRLNKWLRMYLSIAAFTLILITSMGIYGFLSAAYQETANKEGSIEAQVSLVVVKRDNIREQLAVYNAEKLSISDAVTELRSGLSNNKIQYKDKEGNIITTTSSANRKALEKQLDQSIVRQEQLNKKVEDLNEQLFKYESEIVTIETDSELAGELGPLKYLSGLTGVSMDRIINILLLVIIFVFDPLAISLVIAANFAFDQAKPKENLYGEVENDFREWDNLDREGKPESSTEKTVDRSEQNENSSHKIVVDKDPIIDLKNIKVVDPEEVTVKETVEPSPTVNEEKKEEEWKTLNEDDTELKEKKVKRVLQKTPTKRRVEFTDGSQGWVSKGDEDKIVYM